MSSAADLRARLKAERAELRLACVRLLAMVAELATTSRRADSLDLEAFRYATTFTNAVLEHLELAERLEPRGLR